MMSFIQLRKTPPIPVLDGMGGIFVSDSKI